MIITKTGLFLGAVAVVSSVLAHAGPTAAPGSASEPESVPPTSSLAGQVIPGTLDEASARKEMYGKMRSAVEEIASLYGDLPFVQVFTNDRGKAAELRARLSETDSIKRLRAETEALKAERSKLEDELARDRKQAALLSERLARQRAALTLVSRAVEQVNRAVEGTVP